MWYCQRPSGKQVLEGISYGYERLVNVVEICHSCCWAGFLPAGIADNIRVESPCLHFISHSVDLGFSSRVLTIHTEVFNEFV